MIAAFKAELVQAEASASAADKAGQWPPFIRFSDKALNILQAHVVKESSRLAGLSVDGMRKSLEHTAVARQKFEAREFDAANVALKEATTLWPANDLAKQLTAEVAAAKTAVGKPPAATPVPARESPAPAKPKSTPAKATTPLNTSSAATVAPDDSPSFFLSIPGAITVVVTIAAALIGVNVVKKMKAKKGNADVEIR